MALKSLNITMTGSNKTGPAFTQVEQAIKKLDKEMRRVSRSNGSMMKGMSANRRVIQQVGMQISDFSVQLAGGQSAILAFTQNVPQVVQMFGAWGGMLAGLITVLGTFTLVLSKSVSGIEDLEKKLGMNVGYLSAMKSAVMAVGNALAIGLNFIVNYFDVFLAAMVTLVLFKKRTWIVTINLVSKAFMGLIGVMTNVKAMAAVLTRALRIGFLLVVGYLIERVIALRQALGSWSEVFSLIGRVAQEAFKQLPALAYYAGAQIAKAGILMAESVIGAIQYITKPVQGVVNKIIGFFVGAFNAIIITFASLPVVLGEIFSQIPQYAERAAKESANYFIRSYNALQGVAGTADAPFIELFDTSNIEVTTRAAENAAAGISKAFTDSLNFDYLGDGLDGVKDSLESTREGVQAAGDVALEAALKNMPAWKELSSVFDNISERSFDIRNLFEDSGVKELSKEQKEALEKARKGAVDWVNDTGKEIFGFMKKLPEGVGDAAETATNRIKRFGKESAEPFEEIWENAGKALEGIKAAADGITQTFKESFKDLIKGTKNFKDVMLDMLNEIFDRLLDLVFDPYFNAIAGGINKGLGSVFGGGGILGSPTVPSFDGGGFTGYGARVGGIDGRGGGLAILHPNETVIDHTRMSARSGSGRSVTITNQNYFNGVTREEVMEDVAASQRMMKKQIDQEFPGNIRKYQFDRGRGMG